MQPPKCLITLCTDPSKDPSTKSILSHHFNHQLHVLLPTDLYNLISQSLHSSPALATLPAFQRLQMPLGAILESDFWNTYIKKGNVLLVSKSQLDADNVFTLNDGILRMSLDNEAYERAGLQGRQAKFANQPGLMKRRRFLVELNLRSPNYMTGSKQFLKLQHACSTVFPTPQTFLFANLDPKPRDSLQTPVKVLSQVPSRSATPQVSILDNVRIPSFISPNGAIPQGGGNSEEANYHREVWRDWAMEVYEYMALLLMPDGKPADRIRATDEIDPYLSTYVVGDQEDEVPGVGSVTRISFSGLLGKEWILMLWKEIRQMIAELGDVGMMERAWVSLTVQGLENVPVGWKEAERGGLGRSGDGYTVMDLPRQGGQLLYELVGGQEDYS